MEETQKRYSPKIETISYELLKVCAEKGLSIDDMYQLSTAFPHFIRGEISKVEQATKFTVLAD